VLRKLPDILRKMITRNAGEVVSESDFDTATYDPKMYVAEYTVATVARHGLHNQPSLHPAIVESDNIQLNDSSKATEESNDQHREGGNEKNISIRHWIASSADSCATNIYCQLLPVLAVNIGSLSSGFALGYSAVLLPQIRPDDSDISDLTSPKLSEHDYINYTTTRHRPFIVDIEEGSWIGNVISILIFCCLIYLSAGIFGLGAIFGGLLSAYLGNQYGRKMSLILLAIPDLLGWILVASSQNLGMMLAGRFLGGFAAAGYSPAIQIYVGEITQPQHRGWLSGLTVPIMAIGVLTMYVVGSWLPWHLAAASCTPAPLLMVICLAFYWDSPYWYAHSGMDKCAHQALEQFRGRDVNIAQEMFYILHHVKSESQTVWFVEGLLLLVSEKKYFKPFLILNSLFVLMLFSGKFAIDFYAVEIFQHFGSNMNEYLSSVMIAFIHLIGSLFFIPLVKRFSRKLLLVLSSLVMGVSLLLLGLCMYGHSHYSMKVLSDCDWLPIICIVTYMLAAPMGLCSIPYMFISEFYPSEMRSLMGGLTVALSSLELFVVVKTFPNLEESIGDFGVFWLYACVCFGAIIFTLSYIPETKDKDLTKVEGKFAKLGKVIHASPWVTPLPSPSVNSVRKLHFKTHLFTQ